MMKQKKKAKRKRRNYKEIIKIIVILRNYEIMKLRNHEIMNHIIISDKIDFEFCISNFGIEKKFKK